jgi:peptidase E
MTKYILHGGFTSTDNELNRTFYEEIVRDVPNDGTVLLVYFASEDGGVADKGVQDEARIAAQAHGKKLNILVATEGEFRAQLAQADAVYFRGGSTEKLLAALKPYNILKSLFEGKTIAGSSAGAYMLSTYCAAHEGTELRAGLGILPLRVICHAESDRLPPTPESVAELEAREQNLELVVLKDCEWEVVNA